MVRLFSGHAAHNGSESFHRACSPSGFRRRNCMLKKRGIIASQVLVLREVSAHLVFFAGRSLHLEAVLLTL